MFDWDVVIIGGGPAGLTAGLYLGRARRRTILLDKDTVGGYIRNIELVENYPGYAGGIAGAELAAEMVKQAGKYGLETETAEVTGLEVFSGTRWVGCARGRGFTTNIVIIAGGSGHKKLGVPGEEELTGKGVFSCALCDAGQYADKVVAVCGGGNAAVTEALYLSKFASRVLLVHRRDQLRATGILRERALAEPKIEVLWDTVVEEIMGENSVSQIRVRNVKNNQESSLDVSGVLVSIGLKPNTEYLDGIVPLDDQGQIIVNECMETEIPCILAAGDIRSGSPRQIATAVGDGAMAAITAERLLREGG
ncbi:MAG: FAD-dependent oxidoreductase [Chloroflexota bacterium]